jgi:hypothetical protein
LIQPGIRPVVKHASFFSKGGCYKPSPTFNRYAYDLLNNQSLILAEFDPCDHIPQLQVALNYTLIGSESASSFADLVVLSPDSSLYSQLEAYWGNQTFMGEFLLEKYGELSVSKKRPFLVFTLF